MRYEVIRERGAIIGANRYNDDGSVQCFAQNSPLWIELLAFNAAQQSQLDTTDRPQDPILDPELDAITAILDKPDANITAADIKTALLKYLRRKRVQGSL